MRLLNFLASWRRFMFWAVWGCGIACVFLAIVGGYFFDLSGSLVFSWFLTSMALLLAFFIFVAIIVFFIWLIMARPIIVLFFALCVLAILLAVFGFITPESNPIRDLTEMLTSKFEFLNK